MSFDTVADAILDVLRKHDHFSASNTSKYDYRVLAKGVNRAVVIQYGGLEGARRVTSASGRRVNTPWVASLELYVAYKDMNQIGKALVDEVQAVLDHMDAYPSLNGASGVINAFITQPSPPERYRDVNGQPSRWWVVVLPMVVDERSTVTILE